MMDPWQVLGIKPGASEEEAKKAYYALVKKFHPDRFQDPAAKEMANEKLKEINQAYDDIQSGRASGRTNSGYRNDGYNSGANTGYTGANAAAFQQVRQHLNSRRVDQAEAMLDAMSERPAEWYFLRGICYTMRGWYAMAREHLTKAVEMDPNNLEYRGQLNQFDAQTQNYRQNTTPFSRGGGVGGMNTCDLCSCLLCSDCCCESMGGDLISCC